MFRIILKLAHIKGSLLGHLMYLLRTSRYRHSRSNIGLCFPELDNDAVNTLAQQSLREAGKLFFELMFLWLLPGYFCRKSIVSIVGGEHVQKALDNGNGVIFVCPHLGNWEVFNAYVGRFNACVLYKPLHLRWLDNRVRHCREFNGSKLVPITGKGIKALYSELKKGGKVMLLPDQVPKHSGGAGRIMAPFFNTPAWTGTLVSRLAQRPNVSVISGFAYRLPNNKGFEIRLWPAPTEVYSGNLEESATALNRSIESCINNCPQQYTWQYKRFKASASASIYSAAKPNAE